MQSTIYNFRLWNVILKLKLPITLPNRTNNSDIVFQRLYQAFYLVLSAIILFCFCDTSLLIIENGMLFFGFSIWSKTTCSLFFFPIWNLHDNSLVFRFHPYFHHLCLPTKYLVRRWRTISTLQSPCTDTGYAVLQPCRYKSVHKLQGSSSHSIIQNIFTTRQHNVFNTKQPVDEFLISPAVYPYNGKVWD